MSDFLDDERRRLAYADRAETREEQPHPFRDEPLVLAPLADGNGRHSRKEMELKLGLTEEQRPCGSLLFSRPWPCTRCGAAADRDCTYIAGAAMAGDYGPEIHVERLEPKPQTVAGVSFTSVPQLCAAYEYALETLRRMYAIADRKQHAFQSEQDAMTDARTLLLAAGKDVP